MFEFCLNYEITDARITRLAEICPNLHGLILHFCPNITDASIIRLAEGCPKLEALNLK
jgi:hypothetical protein